ncbi:MAG TPA: NDP-sugar synthase [Kofleriaceae bacterium]|nr:NDP-sugar synthase [Kofleriaceae bacterium]
MTRAILLCAGFGTRLGPLSSDRPKPMLPVCDVPIVAYGVALLVGHGITEIVINAHHRGGTLERALGDGRAFGARIQYSHEPELLGTGGGIKRALPLLDPEGTDEPIVSMNGKLIFDLDVTALLAAFRADADALGMMVVRRVPDALAWGPVDVVAEPGGRFRVRDVLAGTGEHMFCGVHVTRPSVMARLPDGETCSIRQGYLPWMHGGERVAAFEADPEAYFAEHSTPERYLASNLALLRGTPLRYPPGPLRGIDPRAHIPASVIVRHPVRVGADAHVGDDVVLGPGTVIGSRATVEQGAVLERCVVWRGARARGELRDCIVTPEGLVDATAS